MPSDIEISLLSSNRILREGLRHILTGHNFRVACATSDPGAICLGHRHEQPVPRIIMIDDASVAEGDGLCAALRRQHPDVRLVILADLFDFDAVVSYFREGVDGYLVKEISSEPLIGALRLVALGEKVFPSELAISMGEHPCPMPSSVNLSDVDLSAREIEVLRLLIQGSANKVIGRQLGICEATVKVHVKAALRKLHVANRTQAAIWAMQHGLAAYDGARAAFGLERLPDSVTRTSVLGGAYRSAAPAIFA